MRRSLLTFVALYLLFVAGCRQPWTRENIYARDQVFIYREHEEREGQTVEQGFAHPAQVSAREIEFLLSRLSHDDKPFLGTAEEEPVFEPREAEQLGKPLALALAAVGPNERLRFLVTRRSLADVFTGVTGVSGVVFRKPEDTLNIAFDSIGEGVHEGEGGRPGDVSFPHEPTEETYSYGLVPPLPASRLHRDPATGEVRKRWLEVDLGGLRESMLAAAEREGPTPRPVASPTGKPDGDEGVPEASPNGETGTETPESVGGTRQPESTDRRATEIRAKLEVLEKLRDSGTITDEEYREQREEILDEL